jgi:hypothetical protein
MVIFVLKLICIATFRFSVGSGCLKDTGTDFKHVSVRTGPTHPPSSAICEMHGEDSGKMKMRDVGGSEVRF